MALALTSAVTASAQDYTLSDDYIVELGKPYPVIDGIKRYYEVEDGIVCVKNDGDRWFIQKLGSDGLTQQAMQQCTKHQIAGEVTEQVGNGQRQGEAGLHGGLDPPGS